MKRRKKLMLFQWSNHTIDEMIEVHKQVMFMKTHTLTNIEKCMVCIGTPEPEEWIEKKPQVKRSESILRNKFKYLSHMIIARCSGNEDTNSAEFSSYILKAIFGNNYEEMLRTLYAMKLIYISDNYTIKRSSKLGDSNHYSYGLLDKEITKEETTNKKILDYHLKCKALLGKINRKELPKTIKEDYKNVLSKLKINEDKALNYVNNVYMDNDPENTELKKLFRLYRIEDFYEQEKPKCDSNGRIYHVLTNLPKDLLKYVNIKYELDAANCHPMLFCSILRDYYNIDMSLIYYLLSKVGNDNISTYSSERLKSLIAQSGFNISLGKHLPEDVVRYMILTFKGMFWDESLKRYNEDDRSKIKKEYFGEVFYSHNNDRYARLLSQGSKKVKYIRKEKRIDFEREYHNVWKVIKAERDKGKKNEKTANNYLPCKLMQIESSIFQEILRRCYARGLDVINIHDAIVVVDTKSNESVSSEEIKDIMLEVFHERELYPTLKKEEFND